MFDAPKEAIAKGLLEPSASMNWIDRKGQNDSFSKKQTSISSIPENSYIETGSACYRCFPDPNANIALKKQICRYMDARLGQGIILAILLFVLFGTDTVILVSAPDSVTPVIDGLLIGSIGVFAVEFLLNILCRPRLKYLVLAMDLISMLSILVEISWIQNVVSSNDGSSGVSRATLTSSRAARMTRLLRIINVTRAIKFSRAAVKFVTFGRLFSAKEEESIEIGKALSETNMNQVM